MPAARGQLWESFLTQLESHLAAGDVATATSWLESYRGKESGEPWPEVLRLAQARWQEVSGQEAVAEVTYRELIKVAQMPKIRERSRQALQGILAREQQARQQAIATAMGAADAGQVGFLVVQPVGAIPREDLARRVARFFQTDVLTAKTWLPVRHPRILRLGSLGELRVYRDWFRAEGIGAGCVTPEAIAAVPVFAVDFFALVSPTQVQAVGPTGALVFDVGQVVRRVEGTVPVFSKVMAFDAQRRLTHKDQVLDRVRVCEVHLPDRVLRFHDNGYQFERGVVLTAAGATTVQARWQALMDWWEVLTPGKRYPGDFTAFGEMALGYGSFLRERVQPRLDLRGSVQSGALPLNTRQWDVCFEVFSALAFGEAP
ncbi:MAG TPA: hypothetical protein DCQ32_02105 [Cyanobacteria bacterium UBA8156]|jgi:hypothetical protein|nr:hypothetical protein [Cyanobacteria bacterium UBA8156]